MANEVVVNIKADATKAKAAIALVIPPFKI